MEVMNYKKLKLKLNHFLFKWYYLKCGEHFSQWSFIYSVKLLIQNYEHLRLLMKNEEIHNQNLSRDNDKLRKELFDIKMNQIGGNTQIDWLNRNFGVNIRKTNEN